MSTEDEHQLILTSEEMHVIRDVLGGAALQKTPEQLAAANQAYDIRWKEAARRSCPCGKGDRIICTQHNEVKQVIVIRRDLNIRRGKEAAQVAHASMKWIGERVQNGKNAALGGSKIEEYVIDSLVEFSQAEWAWLNGSFTKIVCQVPDRPALLDVLDRAWSVDIMAHLVTDAGKTEFNGVPTDTAVAVGPAWADQVDLVTRELKLY
jgi:PTH2 family peptidyl-tRNA hydrolase